MRATDTAVAQTYRTGTREATLFEAHHFQTWNEATRSRIVSGNIPIELSRALLLQLSVHTNETEEQTIALGEQVNLDQLTAIANRLTYNSIEQATIASDPVTHLLYGSGRFEAVEREDGHFEAVERVDGSRLDLVYDSSESGSSVWRTPREEDPPGRSVRRRTDETTGTQPPQPPGNPPLGPPPPPIMQIRETLEARRQIMAEYNDWANRQSRTPPFSRCAFGASICS